MYAIRVEWVLFIDAIEMLGWMQFGIHAAYSHIFSQILTDSSTAHAASYLSSSFHVRIALSSPQCVARYHYGTLTSVHSTFVRYPHLSLHYKTRCISHRFSQILIPSVTAPPWCNNCAGGINGVHWRSKTVVYVLLDHVLYICTLFGVSRLL